MSAGFTSTITPPRRFCRKCSKPCVRILASISAMRRRSTTTGRRRGLRSSGRGIPWRALLGCRASEVVFTSGGTEGDNLAIAGLTGPGDHIVTSSIEHHAVLHACKHLEETGCEVTYVPVDGRGLVDPDDVRRALRPNTKLISIMMANNETGVLQPVEEIGKIAAEADVYFHTDAVQAAGKVPIDVKRIGCRRAVDLRPQDARAAGCGRAVRAQGDAPSAAILRRAA